MPDEAGHRATFPLGEDFPLTQRCDSQWKRQLTGVLMANKRTVYVYLCIYMSGTALVTGEVIANKLESSGNGKIIHPPVSSP